jgi:hypothetical protein
MALGCLQDNATTTNDNSNCRHHQILSACGGFLFSWKFVARGALHPFFSKTPHFPLNQIKLPLRQSPSWLVYFKTGTIIITHTDDCIIVSDSLKDINTFDKSMKTVPKDMS